MNCDSNRGIFFFEKKSFIHKQKMMKAEVAERDNFFFRFQLAV